MEGKRKEGREQGRKGGRKERRKEGGKEGRKEEGRQERLEQTGSPWGRAQAEAQPPSPRARESPQNARDLDLVSHGSDVGSGVSLASRWLQAQILADTGF
eukprot:s1430_g1.t1